MAKTDIKKLVEEEVDKKLKELNKINDNKNTYQKVQNMLKFYRSFKKRVERLEKNEDNITLKKTTGVVGGSFGGQYGYKSDIEKIEDIKEKNLITLEKMKHVIAVIDSSLEEIKNDEYYPVITLKFFDRMTYEDIAEKLNKSVVTIKRNKSRLINELSLIMFPDEILEKI